jgi:hypothetical protein
MGSPLITSQIMHVIELLLKWIFRIIDYNFFFRQPLQPTSKRNKITMRLRTNQELCTQHLQAFMDIYKHFKRQRSFTQCTSKSLPTL